MKMPKWLPQIKRPWNPGYGETWDVMSKLERQWSTVFDFALGLIVMAIVLWSAK